MTGELTVPQLSIRPRPRILAWNTAYDGKLTYSRSQRLRRMGG
jgi:hypothetical protein